MTDREKHIKNLSYIMDSMPDDTCGDWRDSLAYAISSLKTDEAYQLMYEGEEIYTKDEVIAMLTELQDELKYTNLSGVWKTNYAEGFNDSVATSVKKIQCRIDKLRGNE